MERINWRRVVIAGLAVGLAINVGELAIEPLMGHQMEDFFARLKLPVPAESAMLVIGASAFALGVLTMWLYAATRPMYGGGARTASIVGLAVWALSCLFPNVAMLAFGLYTPQLFWFASLWPMVETVVATVLGARMYERGTARVTAAARA